MAKIHVRNVSKSYGETKALEDMSFEVEDKEFVVLFGPAGAGKTTLLSILSGIVDHETGSIFFDDTKIDHVTPNKRNVAMVFENYALYPHFTVYDNIAFPLRSPEHRQPEVAIKDAVESVTKKMNIHHLLNRFPSQLSNGQRQRVALGRALVRSPNVFLMDEPLAHLDAKLKNLMRTELKAMQQQLNTTTIYVTHDYLEAMSLADKIVIINDGHLVQTGTPDDIYYRPVNTFVAKLVGEPEINIYECIIQKQNLIFPASSLTLDIDKKTRNILHTQVGEKSVLVGIRGTDIAVSFEKRQGYYEGIIADFHSIGNKFVIDIAYDTLIIHALVKGDTPLRRDTKIFFEIHKELLFFHADTTLFITRIGKLQ